MVAKLYLVRHGIAEDSNPNGDSARELTNQGRKLFRDHCVTLANEGHRLTTVFHSPWVRAVQTAEILVEVLGGGLQPTPLLAQDPGGDLLNLGSDVDAAWVGHNPWMSEIAAWLVTGTDRHAPGMHFKKGTVAWLTGPRKPGSMRLGGLRQP